MLKSKLGKSLLAILVVMCVALVWFLWPSPRPQATTHAPDAPSRDPLSRRERLPNAPSAAGPESPVVLDAQVETTPPTCLTTHCSGPKCETCSTENCTKATDGCDTIADATDRKLCEDVFACFSDPAHKCVNQGDPLKCWCGTNPTTCVTANDGPTRANGVCRDLVFAAGKSTDADTIRHHFVDAKFPLGRAVNLLLCRGTFCGSECKVP